MAKQQTGAGTDNNSGMDRDVTVTGRRIAQVTASFQGTILDVQGIGQCRPHLDPAPWLFAGALMCLGGTGLFAAELARYEPVDLQAVPTTTELAEASAVVETTEEEDTGLDLAALAALLAVLGIVPLGVGLALRHMPDRSVYTVGEGPSVNFPLPLASLATGGELADGAVPLVRTMGSAGLLVELREGMEGTLEHDGVSTPLSSLTGALGRRSLRLQNDARVTIGLGGAEFVVESVPAETTAIARRPIERPY